MHIPPTVENTTVHVGRLHKPTNGSLLVTHATAGMIGLSLIVSWHAPMALEQELWCIVLLCGALQCL